VKNVSSARNTTRTLGQCWDGSGNGILDGVQAGNRILNPCQMKNAWQWSENTS